MACHAIDRPRADGEGTIDALRSWDLRVAGEGRVGRGTPLGNPFTVIGSGSADEAVAAYWELLKGERSAHEIGRERGVPVHESQGRVSHERRMGALKRLVDRVRCGEVVTVRCPCTHATCHAYMVREWVRREVGRPDQSAR